MTSTNKTATAPTDPGAMTVGELRRQLAERHGTALAQTDKLLADVTVDCVRQDVAQRMSRVAERLARNSSLLDRNAARLSTDENDPLAAVQRDVGALVDLFGVAEVLHGRTRRVRGE
ncbi:Hypothetical protein CGLY_07365 [Corynebacterium glyciniphilum AJ 3170]|uniref:Uncharacterized protein n=1 Tax=Corynebacterium glyciniphilum AJ 3170 TaxID=1404245 RepID=X5DLD4_9CORY|nr:hypothetical protein [Corynebacterium glyciniphilum]AHW63918.1 Hypothetical protein CGLY_07365 [Corynebacterium glyciniphilum AJ 3170]